MADKDPPKTCASPTTSGPATTQAPPTTTAAGISAPTVPTTATATAPTAAQDPGRPSTSRGRHAGMPPQAPMPVGSGPVPKASAKVTRKTETTTEVKLADNASLSDHFPILACLSQISTSQEGLPFDPSKYNWIQVAPGQWTVRAKDASPGRPAGFLGPSARDLMGGNISFSMGGDNVEFGPEHLSPREQPPTYGG